MRLWGGQLKKEKKAFAMKRKKTYVTSFVGGFSLFEHLVEVLFNLGLPFEKLVHKNSAQPHSHDVLPRIYIEIHQRMNQRKNEIEELAFRKRKKEKDGYGACREVFGGHWSTSGFPNPVKRRSPLHWVPSFFPLSLDSTNFRTDQTYFFLESSILGDAKTECVQTM